MNTSNPQDDELKAQLRSLRAAGQIQLDPKIKKLVHAVIVAAIVVSFGFGLLNGHSHTSQASPTSDTPIQAIIFAIILTPIVVGVLIWMKIKQIRSPASQQLLQQINQRRNSIQDPEQRKKFDADLIASVEGDDPPDGKSNKKSLALSLGAFVFICISLLSLRQLHTFHALEVLAILALASAPFSLLASYWIARSQSKTQSGDIKLPASMLKTILTGVPVLALFLSIFLSGLNQWLDFSPSQTKVFQIYAKGVHSNKGGNSYQVYIDSGIPARFAFDQKLGEGIDIAYADYQHVLPHQSRVTLNIHPGLFGFPWYESHPLLTGLSVDK